MLKPKARSGSAVRLNEAAKITPANITGANTSRHAPNTCAVRLIPKKKSRGIIVLSDSVANTPSEYGHKRVTFDLSDHRLAINMITSTSKRNSELTTHVLPH